MKEWQAYNISKPILITGMTGTGKSFLARKIFEKSQINKEKFLTVHMASLKEDLMESELFGHKKGSFTGAIENRVGYLKEVGEGTLFIDEIGELSLEAQKKLLYLLEEKKYVPIGENQPVAFNGRIIMATNKDLKDLVASKLFREDLFFRINTFQIELPAISDDNIKLKNLISKLFLEEKEKHGKMHIQFSEELKMFLENYHWPGNYRELKNVIEYLVLLGRQQTLNLVDLPLWINEKNIVKKAKLEHPYELFEGENYNHSLESFEAYFLKNALTKNGGRVNETARKIGISKSALIYKSRKYGINALKIRAQKIEKLQLLAA